MARAPRIPGWPQNDLLEKEYWEKHPGFAESMVPVWGSAREAIADGLEGDVPGAVLNGVAAFSDLTLAGLAAKGLLKVGVNGVIYVGKKELKDPYAWKRVRAWMNETGFAKPGQDVHHVFFEQNRGIGKYVPKKYKNQPLNSKTMSTPEIHGRLDHQYKGKPRFDPIRRHWYGTPDWFKAAELGAVSHPAGYAKAQFEDEE